MVNFITIKTQRKAKESRSHLVAQVDDATVLKLDDDSTQTIIQGPNRTSEAFYTRLPPELEIRTNGEDASRGRGIFNRAPFRPGDIILSIKPHVAALSNDRREDHCSNCFGGKTSLRRCTACKAVFYCDSACQTKDWSLHKQECPAIQSWINSASSPSSVAGDAIRCLARILWRRKKLGGDSVWVKEIDAMQSHRTKISKDPTSHQSQLYTQLSHGVVQFMGFKSSEEMKAYGLKSAADLVDFVSRFATNTFTITSPELTPLGACVSPLVALINHSCWPNAVAVFPRGASQDQEPLMQVIAIRPIAPNEEILTAYIDTTLPTSLRQAQLQETYHFTCQCQTCIPTPGTVDIREAMFCPKKCGGLCPLPTDEESLVRCNKCKTAVKDTDAVVDAVRVSREGLNKAEALQFSDPQKAIQLTTNLIPILISVGLVPAAYPLLALSRLHTSLLITHLPSPQADVEEIVSPAIQANELAQSTSGHLSPKDVQEALDETIRAATRSCAGLSDILSEGHPVRAVARAELAKLLLVDEPLPKDLDHGAADAQVSPKPGSLPSPTYSKVPQIYPPSGPQRLTLAYKTLLQTRAELMVGFGGLNEGGAVGKEVRSLLVDVEKEIAVWKDGVKNVIQDARLGGLKKDKV